MARGDVRRANLERCNAGIRAQTVGFPLLRGNRPLGKVIGHPALNGIEVRGNRDQSRDPVGVLPGEFGLDILHGISEDFLGCPVLAGFGAMGNEDVLFTSHGESNTWPNGRVHIRRPTSRPRSDMMTLRDAPSTTWSTQSYMPTISAMNSLSAWRSSN